MVKPVKMNEELNVHIEAMSRKGDGIAKVKGFVIFVKGAAMNEDTKIEILEIKNKYAIAHKI